MPAKLKKSTDKIDDLANQGSKSFKQKREKERKASEASGDTRAWNNFFMRPDTVVENIARKYGVSKSELLDREADDLAVRIVLGETQVISETKKALTNAGVNLSSLEEIAAGKTDGIKRSNYVLLVKNLPYDSSEGELAKIFRKFGSLDSNKNFGPAKPFRFVSLDGKSRVCGEEAMNAPDRYERFVVPEGTKKVSYERDTKIINAATFTIEREDHTIGNILRMQLHRDENVLFAGYKLPHPLQYKILVRIHTTSQSSPMQAYNQAINDLDKELDHLKNAFENEVAKHARDF
ncbi:hypothetical protein HRI_003792900 [Hibiscus trionum]|uniref:DNA-directed RNA polymerase RBP11-like dimerisation domain-containing protein n=3 Tax=Malvoideae TaxID=214907 RepID=A0A9W7IS35_HIBTR|nr:hypothetical protein HRI_003792900 [Hibiscus trionum]